MMYDVCPSGLVMVVFCRLLFEHSYTRTFGVEFESDIEPEADSWGSDARLMIADFIGLRCGEFLHGSAANEASGSH